MTRFPRRALLALLLVLPIACASPRAGAPPPPSPEPAAAFPARVIDFQGRDVAIAAVPARIVSIGPSNTEFLFALGAGDRVVGVDDFSDEPAAAKAREKVGGVKVNVEKVVALRPDLVVTTVFSDGTLERLVAASLTVLVVDPQGLSDVPKTALLLGKAVGADGDRLARDITARLDAIREKARALAPRPRVFHEVDATDPAKPYTVGPGSFVHDLIDLAGGTNVAARASSAYPQFSAEELLRADPEVIVLADADYGVSAADVARRPGWSGIAAVRSGRIVPVPANLVSRPGPRVAEAAEVLAKAFHPAAFR